jgi:hypothetical protein
VPTLACALLTLMAVNYNSEWLSLPPHQGIILSSENRFANPADNNRSVQNHLAAVTFEWTNRSEFTSSIGFTRNTNLSN